jgi:hypothetical protein
LRPGLRCAQQAIERPVPGRAAANEDHPIVEPVSKRLKEAPDGVEVVLVRRALADREDETKFHVDQGFQRAASLRLVDRDHALQVDAVVDDADLRLVPGRMLEDRVPSGIRDGDDAARLVHGRGQPGAIVDGASPAHERIMGVVCRVDDPVDVVNRDDQGLGKTPGRKSNGEWKRSNRCPRRKYPRKGGVKGESRGNGTCSSSTRGFSECSCRRRPWRMSKSSRSSSACSSPLTRLSV